MELLLVLVHVLAVVIGICAGYFLAKWPLLILTAASVGSGGVAYYELVEKSYLGNALADGLAFAYMAAFPLSFFLATMWGTALVVRLIRHDKSDMKKFLFR